MTPQNYFLNFANIFEILKSLYIHIWWIALVLLGLSRQFCVLCQMWGSSCQKYILAKVERLCRSKVIGVSLVETDT